jgi:hypothetical protein
MRRALPIVAATAVVSACIETTAVRLPVVEESHVVASPHQVLAAVVHARVRDADSVRVRFHAVGADAAVLDSTPAVVPTGDAATIVVLGLRAERRYAMEVVVHAAGGSVAGAPMELVTAPLPSDLPVFATEGTSPSSGFVLFASGPWIVVIDDAGRVVWYRRTPVAPSLNVMAQSNGRYVVHPTTPARDDVEPWIEIDPSGEITRTLECAGGLSSRLHDLIAEPDGGYWILCDETRTMDLTAFGGSAAARVTGTAVQHVAADGALVFQWSPFDHLALADLPRADLAGEVVNWTHGNAIDIDTDGNLLLSFRNLSEIAKIDARSGAVLWRMGGLANQLALVGAAPPPFARQHGLRASAPGEVVLLDNRGDPDESRAERWRVDAARGTARLVASYSVTPRVVTDIGGSVQPLAGGRLLVSFGTAGRVEEFDASGAVVWRLMGNPGYVFRAQRIASLYAPGVGTSR